MVMFRTLHRGMHGLAYGLAMLGGLVLACVILLICASIFGRTATSILYSDLVQGAAPGLATWALSSGIGPVKGDYELLEAAMPFTIFAFLAYCQISAGHATVDIFTDKLRGRTRRVLAMIIEAVFAAVLVLVAVQMFDGMNTMMRRRSLTFILQFPLWWAYAVAMVPAAIVAVIAVYMAALRLAEAVLNRDLIPQTAGSEH